MAQRVVWSRRALQDAETIAEYIAHDSPAYAAAVVKRMVAQTQVLSRFPNSGRKVPEFDDENIREVFACSYRIIYLVRTADVLIAAIIHGKRVLPDAPF